MALDSVKLRPLTSARPYWFDTVVISMGTDAHLQIGRLVGVFAALVAALVAVEQVVLEHFEVVEVVRVRAAGLVGLVVLGDDAAGDAQLFEQRRAELVRLQVRRFKFGAKVVPDHIAAA